MLSPEEIEAGRKLEAMATPGPVTSSADTANPDEPVDRIYDSKRRIVIQLWPEEGCCTGYEKSRTDGRLYAYLRNHAPALLSAAETVNAARAKLATVNTESLRSATSGMKDDADLWQAIYAIETIRSLIAESEGAR